MQKLSPGWGGSQELEFVHGQVHHDLTMLQWEDLTISSLRCKGISLPRLSSTGFHLSSTNFTRIFNYFA